MDKSESGVVGGVGLGVVACFGGMGSRQGGSILGRSSDGSIPGKVGSGDILGSGAWGVGKGMCWDGDLRLKNPY